MHILAVFGLGFAGFVSGHLDAEAPNSIDKGESIFGSKQVSAPSSNQVETKPIIFIPIHVASHFSFATTLKDDGKDLAGGWQEANANLPFGKAYPWGMKLWYCDINIGMPIRHSVKGYISPTTAATESAKVTNSVASNMDFDLPQGIFCDKFRPAVEEAFKTMYPVGAKAKR